MAVQDIELSARLPPAYDTAAAGSYCFPAMAESISSKRGVGRGGPRPNSGGPRANSGGRRPGAGRKRKVEEIEYVPLGTAWFVVETHPQAERLAAHELIHLGYHVYLPLILIRRRDAAVPSMYHRVREVMFERVVFVEFDRDRDPWQPILKAGGVRRFMAREDGTPIAVERGFIDKLIAGDDERLQLQEKLQPLKAGTTVRVEEGALSGNAGIVLECDGFLTWIDLAVFNGRLVRTHLPRASLSIINES